MKPTMSDPLIIPRVQQYLEENVDKTYVDVGVMARELQQRYPEYNRRKQVPFRQLVEQAYKTVLHSYGLDSNPSSDNEEEDDDLEVMDENNHPNQMGDTLNNLYLKNKAGGGMTPQNEGEAIDISSDDDEETEESSKQSATGEVISRLQLNPQVVVQLAKKRKMEEANAASAVLLPAQPVSILAPKPDPVVAPPPTSKPRKYKKEVTSRRVETTFADVGGMDRTLKQLCELLLHVKHPEIYQHIGLPPPRGFLLHGPPGSGKTLLANAIAGQLAVPLIDVPATELVAGVSGESEERIRDVFDQAAALAPCVLFIDEIDAISSNRMNAQKDMERRIVAQLLNSLDGLAGKQVLVIGATNRADCLDPALRRVGRFDQEISLGIPDRDARCAILKIICRRLKLETPFDFDQLAALTPGYVGADLLALATRAASTAVKRIFSTKEDDLVIVEEDVKEIPKKSIQMEVDEILDSITKETDETPKMNGNAAPIELDDESQTAPEESKPEESKPEEKPLTPPPEVTEVVEEKKEETPIIIQEGCLQEEEKKEVEEKQDDVLSVVAELAEKVAEEIREPMDTSETEKSTTEEPKEITEETTIPIVEQKQEETPIVAAVAPEEPKPSEPKPSEEPKQSEEPPATVEEEQPAPIVIKETPEPVIVPTPTQHRVQLKLEDMLGWLTGQASPLSPQELNDLCITFADFESALKLVQPSAKREGFITVPDVTWDDIGSLTDIRDELKLAILAPVKFPERLEALGLTAPSGVLLCGPPGCGKTLLAKAVANEAGINFISVKGPELLNMYVGESERAVRQCFQRARNSAPCVIFFDEFDSLCPRRSEGSENSAGMRVVNQLLTEMDGIEERRGVFLMAATNRPDIVDPAVLRPGRFDKILYVGLPNSAARVEILAAVTRNGTRPPFAADVDAQELARLTEGLTGADLAGLVRQASLFALKDSIRDETATLCVTRDHLLAALRSCKPSVSTADHTHYERLREIYASNAAGAGGQ